MGWGQSKEFKPRFKYTPEGFVMWLNMKYEEKDDKIIVNIKDKGCCGLSDETKCLGCGKTHKQRKAEFADRVRIYIGRVKRINRCRDEQLKRVVDYLYSRKDELEYWDFSYTYGGGRDKQLLSEEEEGWLAIDRKEWQQWVLAQEELFISKKCAESAPEGTTGEGERSDPEFTRGETQ